MLDIFKSGGPVLIVIVFLSFIATVIVIERLIYFRKIKVNQKKLSQRLKVALSQKHYQEALVICDDKPAPLTNIVKVGINNRDLGIDEVKELMLSQAQLEVPKLERFISPLGTIAHIAPLLGLLGTVTGNIKAFSLLGSGQVDPTKLAGGISEALYTTAAGMIVGIPAIIFYNALVSKVNKEILVLENRVNELALFIKEGSERVENIGD